MIELITAWIVNLYYVPYIGWLLATVFGLGIIGVCYIITLQLISLVYYLCTKDVLIHTFTNNEQAITKNLLNLSLVFFVLRVVWLLND